MILYINQPAYLQTDWSKERIGYLLLQKHCDCPMPNAPVCCPTGWHLVYAGSRFTTSAESQYVPAEGEALAVAWGLDHALMFILGCEDLIVATDDQPLLGIFNDWDLGTITRIHASKISKAKLSDFSLLCSIAQGSGHRDPVLCQDTQQLQLLKIILRCHPQEPVQRQ